MRLIVGQRCPQKLDGKTIFLRSGILAETISITSISLQQRRSISFASFLQCPHFRSSCLELFCKKVFLQNFKKIKKHLFSQNTSSGRFWHFLQSRFPVVIPYVINGQPRSGCLVSFYGGVKDFIFTCISLRITTFFMKI